MPNFAPSKVAVTAEQRVAEAFVVIRDRKIIKISLSDVPSCDRWWRGEDGTREKEQDIKSVTIHNSQ
jgi:hypothetical protein